MHLGKPKLSITAVYGYVYDEVYAAVQSAVGLLGGLARFVPSGSKVFVKINHLSPPSPAERGIVTHPVFTEAVLGLLKQITSDITVGDDIDSGQEDGFEVSGYRQMCKRMGVKLLNLREEGFVRKECKDGCTLKQAYIAKAALDADVVINLPKLKTHSLTVLTCAIKNMYGVLPGGIRRRYHAAYVARHDFNHMLVDVYSQAKPQLNIMDGIMAMEGEGPAGGSMRDVGVVLACADAVALDAVAATIIEMNPVDVPAIRYAAERDFGVANIEHIEIVGATIDSVKVADFKHPASSSGAAMEKAPRFLSSFIINQLDVKPKVIKGKCTGCTECEKVCPVEAITMVDELAKVNDGLCIKCLCCHEVCRYDAIIPKRSLGGRVLSFIGSKLQKRFNKS